MTLASKLLNCEFVLFASKLPMDTISLSEYATELDGETITSLEHLSLEGPRPTELLSGERPRCVDCNKRHIPRRFPYCVDGTWMVEDGSEGSIPSSLCPLVSYALIWQ